MQRPRQRKRKRRQREQLDLDRGRSLPALSTRLQRALSLGPQLRPRVHYAACGYDGGDCNVLREWRGGFAWVRPAAPAAGAGSAGQLLELPLATRAVGVDLAGVLGSAPVAAAYVHEAGVAQGGCASFRTLHEAQGACAALGLGRCGGVTQSNRFECASHDFELRRGSGHQPSRTTLRKVLRNGAQSGAAHLRRAAARERDGRHRD